MPRTRNRRIWRVRITGAGIEASKGRILAGCEALRREPCRRAVVRNATSTDDDSDQH
jgi:hypothetical protein